MRCRNYLLSELQLIIFLIIYTMKLYYYLLYLYRYFVLFLSNATSDKYTVKNNCNKFLPLPKDFHETLQQTCFMKMLQ